MFSLRFTLFLCAFLSSAFRRNPVLCSPSYSPNPNDSSSNFTSNFKTSSVEKHPPTTLVDDRSSLRDQQSKLTLNDFNRLDHHSRYSDETVLDDRLNKKFATPTQLTNRVPPSSNRKSISDLNPIFLKVYESNYAHFCPCPPELRGARHSLEGAGDRTVTECIYLPITTVRYQCIRTARKQSSQIVDGLVCDLNPSTNRLDWIVDVDDKLIDLDDRLVYRDQVTADRADRNETMEIRDQSAQLSDFSIEFLQCNDPDEKASKVGKRKLPSDSVLQGPSPLQHLQGLQSSPTESANSPRTKRSYSLERNVEVLIVIDSLMNRYHGDNLEHYIYTLMSMVSSIYKDASIGNSITIAVVQLILLTEKETKQLISSSAANTLNRFCRWQVNLNANRTDAHPLWHDMAILLTRMDLCRSGGHCDTLGLAHSAKICDGKSSCAIVEDNGLSTALTIAHEIGHNLGIPHDQDEKCRQLADDRLIGHDEQFNLMGKMLDLNSYPWKWSECSAYFLTEFFDSDKGDCLLDKPKRNFLDVITMRGVTEEQISRNYESLLKTKSTSDRRLLNMMSSNRIERERRDHRSNFLISNEIDRKSSLYETAFNRNKQNLLPGRYFNTDLQCQLIFGPESRVCPYMSPCRRLWCTSGSALSLTPAFENEIPSFSRHPYGQFKRGQENLATLKQTEAGCKTQHQPWADGTPCSNSTDVERFCVRGECVAWQAYAENSAIVNGGWSQWSNWTECSRVCGGGVRSSFRVCNRPEPRNGGAFCLGQRQRYESCQVHRCPESTADFRAEQCAQFNKKELKNLPVNVSWLPHYAGISPEDSCKLYCRVESTGAYFLLKNKVADGTDCLESGKCIDGRCIDAGCDHVIHSKKRFDECGVCGGSNSTCTSIEGRFDRPSVHYGYNHVTRIPAGAINILIRQLDGTADDDNSLALRFHDDSYLINGDAIISNYERVVFYDGVKIVYSGTGFANEITTSSVDQNASTEEETLRLSSHEQRLREEYNSQLDQLKRNRASYSRDHIERLHEQQHKIREYRRQIENLTKMISINPGQAVKQRIGKPFVESISIKQALKSDLIVEVLSVGRLVRPEIVYRYSIHSREISRPKRPERVKSRTHPRDDLKSEDRRAARDSNNFKQSLKHSLGHQHSAEKLADEASDKKKEIDSKQLSIDEQNLKSNDQLILRKLKSYVKTGEPRSSKRIRSDQAGHFENGTDHIASHSIKIGQYLHVRRGTKRVQIRCPPRNAMKSLVNSKWFKNGQEIFFSSQQPESEKGNRNDEDKRLAENPEEHSSDSESEQTARYQITRRGSLVIRNVKQTDAGIYACPLHISYSQIFVI